MERVSAASTEAIASCTSLQRNLVDTKASPHDIVTSADLAVEDILLEELGALLNVPCCSEERSPTADPAIEDMAWVVDPIDGSTFYLRSAPFATCMVSLVDKGHPLLSVISAMDGEWQLSAVRGAGVRSRGTLAAGLSPRVPGSPWFASVEMSTHHPNFQQVVRSLFPPARPVHLCAAGYEASMLVQGWLDARITWSTSGQIWDYAAPALICQEAGMSIWNIGAASFSLKQLDFVVCRAELAIALKRWEEFWLADDSRALKL